ncbi:hypothetical protein AB6A40_008097 [Gnathostoma spinigerum]|uniref:Regulatory protein zeste n=1 Tax=Gnathostoma spinigerum TaxID=75299 RepID=A0ABD6EWF4_9BILA
MRKINDMDEERRLRRPKKPNFTAEERMYLVRNYVDNVLEYNRGFTAATRGDAKHGRTRLLEKWAKELTAFGVAERTTGEIEQKLRDYMKKIIGNNRRPAKRPLSPAAELLSTVMPQLSNSNDDRTATANDPSTDYANFLLRQHRAESDEPNDNGVSHPQPIENNVSRNVTDNSHINFTEEASSTDLGLLPELPLQLADTARLQRSLLNQQLDNARTEHAIKLVLLESLRIEQRIKALELKRKKIELDRLRLDRLDRSDTSLEDDTSKSLTNGDLSLINQIFESEMVE